MPPERVGEYSIEEKLGAGGMGTVYLGRHSESGRVAAVKVLPASLSREPGFVARFTREIDSLKQLSNPHIVELYESGVDGDVHFYAMEYVAGETLTARLMREKRLDWRTTIDISVQVCAALKAAHDAGIVHRDLKPSNLMLAENGDVKLTDFGVAQVFAGRRLTATGGVIGTAEYMSPEQAAGRRATKKSDIYSLGALMYVMLTGRPPFTGNTQMEVIHKHRYAQFDRPQMYVPELPYWLDDLVCLCMDKDSDKRPPDAYVLSRRLSEIVKKVDLQNRDLTLAIEGAKAVDGDAPTVAAGASELHDRVMGSGTLMRDLVKAEVEIAHAPSFIGRLLNNTLVLLALLALLIAGGFWWFNSRELSPEQMYAAGAELMDAPAGPGWLQARDDYFQPLLEADAQEWSAKVEPHLERIELYELKRRAGLTARKPAVRPPGNEVRRLLILATHQRERGDIDAAERTLRGLIALASDADEYETDMKLSQGKLSEIQQRRAADGSRRKFVDAALARADRLATASKPAEARRIWSSIVDLYGNSPDLQSQVERARTRLHAAKLSRSAD